MTSELIRIIHDPRGYYTFFVNGLFAGNFDTMKEAVDEAEAMSLSETRTA